MLIKKVVMLIKYIPDRKCEFRRCKGVCSTYRPFDLSQSQFRENLNRNRFGACLHNKLIRHGILYDKCL